MSIIFCHLLRAAALLVLCLAAARAADWKADKVVEFVVPTGPGSGVDASARTVQQIFQANKLVEQAINVSNKPGGNAAGKPLETGKSGRFCKSRRQPKRQHRRQK